ncbi:MULTISPECIES: hypothetical protein [unclassified Bradyrhizobium]|uniref:hypothetical protein n=1 Tax=unclassified Bradyrhizobium TaxID=2631580 RepID=UPI001FFFD407|nr:MULTISPECIES: hypothetical protein [unclassified Bradyrhizobium]
MDFDPTRQELRPVPTTKVAERQAKRASLDVRVRTEAARILAQRGISPGGREFDRQFQGRDNLIILKTAIDREITAAVGTNKKRSDYSRQDLDMVDERFAALVSLAAQKVIDGS